MNKAFSAIIQMVKKEDAQLAKELTKIKDRDETLRDAFQHEVLALVSIQMGLAKIPAESH